jgi:glucosamine-6-phosphate deaminase
MLILIEESYAELTRGAARIVANALRRKPELRIGFATGGIPVGLYRELVRLHREERLDFSRVVSFNLDEYIGLPADHPQSFHSYMRRNLFDHINIRSENVHIPDGNWRGSLSDYCASYEALIARAGGIDLQVLGIGKDGHIGFNEPTSSLASRTRPKTLTQQTIEDNRKGFGPNEQPPDAAITMGIGTILEARRILLLASGAAKARAVALAVEGPITASVSASALQLHGDTTLLLDQEASVALRHVDYYRRVAEGTRRLNPERLW